ncbi:MAG: hypothetical protein O9324_19750 [Microcystis sp. LE19-84.1B]|uniref:hypothetical protein n=1 Tax=Microcystis sp. LE19-84.1B TaxID=3016438 RepID=UPI0022BE5316|nr:hypothetical protein [Microcystis sp. LE19-84.1B]MCZ8226121.1 hypothetical protein [Microcystis sp. LE19-84.1B]
MAIIQGSQVPHFTDRLITVTVTLNRADDEAKKINENKFEPVMLDNTYKLDGMKFIGNACVVPKDAPLNFLIASSGGICGLMPKLKTTYEGEIFKDIYYTTKSKYQLRTASVRRYSAKPKFIEVADFRDYEKTEGFNRSNLEISAYEVLKYTEDGIHYPRDSSEITSSSLNVASDFVSIDVVPGAIHEGRDSSETWGKISDVEVGKELGAMQMYIFVVKDLNAFNDLVQKVPGISGEDSW